MCAYRTAWSRNTSSLPSDRIPPSNVQRATPKAEGAKGKQREAEIPKSREVLKLEELRDELRNSVEKSPARDPKGGCFCQARNHELSTYASICRRCGLILCEVNLPYYACPHCSSPLLTPEAADTLIASLEQSILDTLDREERTRQQAIEEARKAAGAFPTLGASPSDAPLRSINNASSTSLNSLDSHPVNQPHKVLSLNSKTKRVTVASYKPVQRPPKAAVSKEPQEVTEPEPTRVPRPPNEVPFLSKPPDAERPWMNSKLEPVTYVPPPKNTAEASTKGSRRKGKQASGARQGEKENSDA